jgi:hypothetical protein
MYLILSLLISLFSFSAFAAPLEIGSFNDSSGKEIKIAIDRQDQLIHVGGVSYFLESRATSFLIPSAGYRELPSPAAGVSIQEAIVITYHPQDFPGVPGCKDGEGRIMRVVQASEPQYSKPTEWICFVKVGPKK